MFDYINAAAATLTVSRDVGSSAGTVQGRYLVLGNLLEVDMRLPVPDCSDLPRQAIGMGATTVEAGQCRSHTLREICAAKWHAMCLPTGVSLKAEVR